MRPIRADSAAQRRLLEVQTVDTALAQLAHRRKTLPEHAELARLHGEQTATASDLVGADTRVSDLELEQERAEADLEPVRQRLARNEQRIAAGSVADPKALNAMVEEVTHLRRRISDLEDAELEVMEQLEAATATRDTLRARAEELAGQARTVSAKRDLQLHELDEEVAAQRTERERLVPDLPADLLTLFTKIAASRSGVGAAELRQRRCTGCQLEINAAELREFAAATEDEVLRCEECARILVRTAESGL